MDLYYPGISLPPWGSSFPLETLARCYPGGYIRGEQIPPERGSSPTIALFTFAHPICAAGSCTRCICSDPACLSCSGRSAKISVVALQSEDV
jgi:hypothetical protein